MLELVVFLCGAAVMILEMVGARIIAPYLGSSILVWTGLIGTILASLSLGYWWGGRLADRRPSLETLGRIILFSGLSMALVAPAKSLVLDFWSSALAPAHLTITLVNFILFAPTSILLGMVSPYAVRLRITSVEKAGAVSGRLYALSTLGSICGTFLAGFFLIATFGSANILVCLSALLVIASFLTSFADKTGKSAALALVLLLGYGLHAYSHHLESLGFHDVDTRYSRVLVFPSRDTRTERATRAMATTPRHVQSSMYVDAPTEMVLDYTRFFKLAWHFVPRLNRMLLLGGGGYSFPKYAMERDPGLVLDVVELDPGVTEIAGRFFALKDTPGLNLFHEDARTFINRAQGPYDVILGDVFNAHYSIPFHLTTLETVRRLHDLLAEDGVVILNTIAALEGMRGRFLRAEYRTYRAVFPQVYLFPLQAPSEGHVLQNVMLVAAKSNTPLDLSRTDPELSDLLQRQWTQPLPEDVPLLTDDFAPVDNYVAALW